MSEVTLVNATEFAEYLGISRPTLNKLIKAGIVPHFGTRPIFIPLEAACAAIVRHAEQTSAAAQKEGAPDEI